MKSNLFILFFGKFDPLWSGKARRAVRESRPRHASRQNDPVVRRSPDLNLSSTVRHLAGSTESWRKKLDTKHNREYFLCKVLQYHTRSSSTALKNFLLLKISWPLTKKPL